MSSGLSDALATLRGYLTYVPCLDPPPQPDQSVYNFGKFTPKPQDIEAVGLESAIDLDLERLFGPRSFGGVLFKEGGPGLVAVVDVLAKYLKSFPMSEVLRKWIVDLTDSSKDLYEIYKVPVCYRNCPYLPFKLSTII